MTSARNPIVLAFSGGLDTSFCVPWLKETYKRPVVTVTVNCGGIDAAAARALDERARALGAVDHRLIEARPEFFDRVIKYLIMGNVRRGNLYPLSVGAERGLQAKYLAQLAKELGSDTVAHGCTAAGNDQVRFEIVLKAVAPELTILAPVRDHAWQRPAQVKFLEERKMPVPTRGSAYSTNRGLWGVTIGGTETLDSKGSIPESAWVLSAGALDKPQPFARDRDRVRAGRARRARRQAARRRRADRESRRARRALRHRPRHSLGRHDHRHERPRRVRGAGGRDPDQRAPRAREADAARHASDVKEPVSQVYGQLIHEGKQLDPACRDIEALLESSQARVTGKVRVQLRPGSLFVLGVTSPHSLMAVSRGKYGEAAGEWTPADAYGFSKIMALPGMFHTRAGGQ